MLETKRAKDATAIAQKILALVVNQCILPEVIEGNRFLSSRAEVQGRFLEQIEARFENLTRVRLPLLDRDLSELDILRTVGDLLYNSPPPVHDRLLAPNGAIKYLNE
ncbi:MAG: hypothetical protein NTU59_01720 [Coprothermobacterota bacterium]|nr:hypothetical protein [Coprothermobacterota bacterium]